MPMTPLLDRPEFDPETKRAMHTAFEMAREALQLDEQSNLAERVAKTIVEVAKTGERNSDLLCECVLREFRRHLKRNAAAMFPRRRWEATPTGLPPRNSEDRSSEMDR